MKLQRLTQTSAVTLGRLLTDSNEELCKTLELPWRDNATGVSCIPAGHYTARRRFSPEHRCDVFEIENVTRRQNVEIHHGNTVKDTKGCVIVGTTFGTLDGVQAVLRSDLAFANLMGALVGVESFSIEVIDVEGKQEALS